MLLSMQPYDQFLQNITAPTRDGVDNRLFGVNDQSELSPGVVVYSQIQNGWSYEAYCVLCRNFIRMS